jgi:hypothetical protein
LKHLALDQAIRLHNKTSLLNIMHNLSLTERNTVLKDGESNVALETNKLNNNSDKNIMDKIEKIFEKNACKNNESADKYFTPSPSCYT